MFAPSWAHARTSKFEKVVQKSRLGAAFLTSRPTERQFFIMKPVFRNVFFVATVVVSTALTALSVIVLALVPSTEKLLRTLEGWWARSIVFASGVRIIWKGPRLDPGRNYVFIANHQSHLDTPIFLSLLAAWRPRFLAKESLFRIPLFGPGMRRTGHIPVDRENRRKGMEGIRKAVEQIDNGDSVLIFPEGTRNLSDEGLQSFQIGAFIIALKAGRPVIPVIIQGTRKVLPKGSITVSPGPVRVQVLDAFQIQETMTIKDRDRLKNEVWEVMNTSYAEMNEWTETTQ